MGEKRDKTGSRYLPRWYAGLVLGSVSVSKGKGLVRQQRSTSSPPRRSAISNVLWVPSLLFLSPKETTDIGSF